ncbi:hypothetical protein A2U01_0072687, partial [Trifolium medium]|nr:hypothetical protein [Trifolium medium]
MEPCSKEECAYVICSTKYAAKLRTT